MKKDIKLILERNYKTCYHAYNVTKSETVKHDLHQRMDEIYLIYSDIFDVCVVKAKIDLEKAAKRIMKEESQFAESLDSEQEGGQ
jgi:hypothetical protein